MCRMSGPASSPFDMGGLQLHPQPLDRLQIVLMLSFRHGMAIGRFFANRLSASSFGFPEHRAMLFDRSRAQDAQGSQDDQNHEVIPATGPQLEIANDFLSASGNESTSFPQDKFVCTLNPGQTLKCGLGVRYDCQEELLFLQFKHWGLTAQDVLRWNRAARTLTKESSGDSPGDDKIPYRTDEAQIFKRSRNFVLDQPRGKLGNYHMTKLYYQGLLAITVVYGAVHLALWNYAFPSHAEMMLWKISGCTMVAPPVFVVAKYVGRFALSFRWHRPWCFPVFFEMWSSLSTVYAFLYIFARIFIVVESLLSLRMVPAEVYEGITWADSIPHL